MSGRRSTWRGSSGSRPRPTPIVTELDAPLTIGLISDTHISPQRERRLPEPVLALFRRYEVGLIVHLGDVTALHVLDELSRIAPVLALLGNNDIGEVSDLPMQRELRVGATRLLLLHGQGGSSARAVAMSSIGDYDGVIYGHSHKPIIEHVNGKLLMNPGSPTDKRWNAHFGIGILNVGVGRIDPELILFNRPEELAHIDPLPVVR